MSPEEVEQIAAETGMPPEAHAARIQASLDRIVEGATARQQEAVDTCDQKGTEVEQELDGRAGEAQGRVAQAVGVLQASYGQARTTVTGAASAARGQVETDGESAESTIATSAESNKEQARADYDAYGAQVEALIVEWQPVFQLLFDEAGTSCQEVAIEKSEALEGQTAAVDEYFKTSGNRLDTYIGQVRASLAKSKLPEAASAMKSGGESQKTTMQAEGESFAEVIRTTLTPLTARATQVGVDAQGAVDTAKTNAEQRLESEREQTGKDIDTAESGALETLSADQTAAEGEATAIGARINEDIGIRKLEARNRFTELSASLAERYKAFAEETEASLPDGQEFVPFDSLDPTLSARSAALETMHTGVVAEIDSTYQTVIDDMNRSIDQQLQQLDSIVTDATGEADVLAQQKAGAIGESATKFGQGMLEVGTSIDQAMAQYTEPTQASLEQHKSDCIAELTTLKGTTKASLDARVIQYGSELDTQNQNFCTRVEPDVISAARQKEVELEGRAKKAYSAMRGAGTDENGVYDALRGLESGQPPALRHIFEEIAGSSLDSWLADDLNEEELAIANAHLALDHAVAARLEIADQVNWYGDDEAQIEKILRGLPEEERQKIANSSEWDSTRDLLKDNLSGTDLDVTDALMANKVHRADALRLREKIEEARRTGNNDAVHEALEGIPKEEMEQVAQEFAHIQGEVNLDTGGEIDGDAAKNLLVEFTTEDKVVGYDHRTGRELKTTMTGANKDLATALIMDGADSIDARVARLEVENTRSGGPKDANIEKALYASPELQEALHSQDPARVEEARQQIEAQKAELARAYGEKYGTEGGDNSQLLNNMLGNLGEQEDKGELYQQMFADGFNSPEVAKQQIKAAVDGAGTDEDAIKRALKGMHPDEIAELRRIYPELEQDLGTNGNGGFFTELSGEDRMDVEIALLGDEQWMNDAQRFELARKKYDWQRGSESTALGRLFMDGSNEAEQLDKHFETLEGYQSRIVDGKFQGTKEEYEQYLRTCRYVGITAALYQEQSDRIANGITTGLAVTGAVVAAALTGGAASPLVVMAVTAGTGVASVGTNYAMKGGRYGWENAVKDLGMTAVDTALAGGGAKYLKGLGSNVTMADKVRVGAGSGFIRSSIGTAVEDKTWQDGFTAGLGQTFKQGIKGGLVGGVTSYASNKIESTRIGKKLVESHSPLLRGTGKALSGGAGGFAGSTTGMAYDAAMGDYKGTDLSMAGQHIFTETLKGSVQGFLEGVAEVPKAKQLEAQKQRDAAQQEADDQVRQAETDAETKLEAQDTESSKQVKDTVEQLTPRDSEPGDAPKAPEAPEVQDTGPQGKGPQEAFEQKLQSVKGDTDGTKRQVVDETQSRLTDAEETLTKKNTEIDEALLSEVQSVSQTKRGDNDDGTVRSPDGSSTEDGPTTKPAGGVDDAGELSSEQSKLAESAVDLGDELLNRMIALETKQNGNPLVTELVFKLAVDDIGEATRVLTVLEEYNALMGEDPKTMTPEQMTTVLKAHFHLSEHASPDFLRKVIPQSSVIEHLNQKRQTMGGSVGDPLNTEGLSAGQKVETLGLDYADEKGNLPYLNVGEDGSTSPVDELFFIDSDYSEGMKQKAKIPVDEVLLEFAKTSDDPEIQKVLPQLTQKDVTRVPGTDVKDGHDPYTGTGGTKHGDHLQNGLVRTNQERMIQTGGGYYGEKYGTGTQIKYQGPDGSVIVVATFIELPDRTIVQMNPDLPPEIRAKIGGKLDQRIVHGQ